MINNHLRANSLIKSMKAILIFDICNIPTASIIKSLKKNSGNSQKYNLTQNEKLFPAQSPSTIG